MGVDGNPVDTQFVSVVVPVAFDTSKLVIAPYVFDLGGGNPTGTVDVATALPSEIYADVPLTSYPQWRIVTVVVSGKLTVPTGVQLAGVAVIVRCPDVSSWSVAEFVAFGSDSPSPNVKLVATSGLAQGELHGCSTACSFAQKDRVRTQPRARSRAAVFRT